MRRIAARTGWLKRWRRDLALAGCLSAAIGILLVSELGHRELTRHYQYSIQSMWVGSRLTELSARLTEAEAGQRSYLLTWQQEYLDPYKRAAPSIRQLLSDLRPRYARDPDPDADKVFGALTAAIGAKLGEIELTLQLAERGHSDHALQVVDSGIGRRTMDEIRSLLDDLAQRETGHRRNASGAWESSLAFSRLGVAVATAVTMLLLTVLFTGLRRDRRRERERQDLLNRAVRERTRQLDLLASRLQEASEAEKAAMARELHDELGALLTASKMDLARIENQLGGEHAHLRERLAAVMENLDQGLAAKRRIVEGLRPSTLSYFGLGAAARDLAEQIAERAGWQLDIDLAEPDSKLPDEVEIALYRVLQESLTNAAKYAQAEKVRVTLDCDAVQCRLEIEDDGVGFRASDVRTCSQGLFGMRHRVEARGGVFDVKASPGCGTRIRVVIPRAVSRPPAPVAPWPERAESLELAGA